MGELGLASIAFRHLSVEEIIAAAKDAGLHWIEWGSDIHAPADDVQKLDRVVQLTREAGLEISSYGTYFRIDRDRPEDIAGYIHAAKRLGTNILRIWCPGNPGVLTEQERLDRYERCRQVAAIAQDMGAVLCAECHNDNLTDNAQSALELMRAVDSPAFRMYWQPHPYFSAQENTDFAAAVEAYVANVHVFNWHGRERFPLEEARTAWQAYAKVLGKDRVYLLEHFQNDDPGLLVQETQTLRSIIEKL